MLGNERLLRKMSIGDILDYSIELYKRNFKQLFILSLVLYIPFILIYTAVSSYMTGDIMKAAGLDIASDMVTDASDSIYRFFAQLILIGIMSLLYIAFSITLQPVLDASVTQIIYNDAVNGKISQWRDIMKKSFKKFGRLVLGRFLFGLILYGISTAAVMIFYFATIVIIMFSVTAYTAGSGITGVGEVLAIVGIVGLSVLFIAGVALFIGYFAMRFGLGTQSVIIENTTASKSISRSHEITAKKFWHAGLTVGTALLMTALLPLILGSAAYLLIFVDKNLYALGNIIVQIIAGIFQPFLTVVMTMVFIDLKVRKEGLDLEAQVDKMLEEEKRQEELLRGGEPINA